MKAFCGYFLLFLALFLNINPAFAGIFSKSFRKTYDKTQDEIPLRSPVEPSTSFDLWKHVQELGDRVVVYANKTLIEEALKDAVPLEEINELMNGVHDLLNATRTFAIGLQGSHDLDRRNFEMADLVERFSLEIDKLSESLMNEFKEPPPENKTERYSRREAQATFILDKVEDILVDVCHRTGWNISETELREKFNPVKSHIKEVVLGIGNIADHHPVVVDVVMFFVAVSITGPIIEGLFCRPLLRLFGFSALGPVRGSFAAWAQKQFFGGAVEKGSWFAMLQSAGMSTKSVLGLGRVLLAGIGSAITAGIKAVVGS